MSKLYRLSKIFRPETGNALILPIDHGISAGNVRGLENPQKVLEDLNTPEVDAVLMTGGIGKQTESVFYGRNAPARIKTLDVVYTDNNKAYDDLNVDVNTAKNKIYHELTTDVETAVRQGYDCLKLIMFWDRPAEEQIKSVQIISQVINEAEKWEIPVLVEPLTFDYIENEEERIQVLSDAARIAYELGADILKLPHPGNIETIKTWVNNFNVPIILLGGATKGNADSVINQLAEAISVGVRGVAIGRNLWQRPTEEAKEMLSDLAKVVHNKQN